MANADAAFGLRPVKHRSGAPYNGAANPYYKPASYATAMFVGDPALVTGTSNTAEVTFPGVGNFIAGTLPEINVAADTGDISGVVVGFGTDPNALELAYSPASTEAIVWLADDPDLMFEVQEDSVGGALAATDVAQNSNLVAGSGSTVTNLSGWEIDSSDANTTNTLQVRLERLVNRADNEIGTNAKWLVSILQHSSRNATGV